jgi:hypothetical protein
METIYESRESFPVQMTPGAAIQVLIDNLKAEGYKPHADGSSLTVHTGSNFFLRIWGTMLPWGRKSVPVGMTVDFDETTMGSIANVHAYDRLGWYLDARTNSVLEGECQRKMALLTELARKALNSQI